MKKSHFIGAVCTCFVSLLIASMADAAVIYQNIEKAAHSNTGQNTQFGTRCPTPPITSDVTAPTLMEISSSSDSIFCVGQTAPGIAGSSGAYGWSEITTDGYSFGGASGASVEAGNTWSASSSGRTTLNIFFSENTKLSLNWLETKTVDNEHNQADVSNGVLLRCTSSFTSCGFVFQGQDIDDFNDIWRSAENNILLETSVLVPSGYYQLFTSTSAGASSDGFSSGEIETSSLDYSILFAILRCDLNDNGYVDVGDLSQVVRMVFDLRGDDLDCDLNNGGLGDGLITTADVVIVTRIVIGIIPEIWN